MTAQTLTLTDRILAGQTPEGTTYSDSEWTEAARMALDCEDESELRWMLEQRPLMDEYGEAARERHSRWMIERAMGEAA
jgi:hypothetical protein